MSESILSELFRLSLNVYEVKVLKKKCWGIILQKRLSYFMLIYLEMYQLL